MDNYKNYENYNIENLKNINDIRVNIKLPKQERMLDYIKQIGNPCCYKDEERKVILTFKDDCEEIEKENKTERNFLEKCIKQYFKI